MYDLIIKGGHIIDPAQGFDQIGSIAIQNDKIRLVSQDILSEDAKRVIDASGKFVAPGLIDIHCHPTAGYNWLGIPADKYGLNCGVTYLCDAGSSGAATFEAMYRIAIIPAKTDISCFLNLSSTGLVTMPEIRTKQDIDLDYSESIIEKHTDRIKGVKLRLVESLADSVGIEGVKMAKALAAKFRLPLMMHIGESRPRVPNDKMDTFSREALSFMEEGDILSHYLTWEPGGVILKDGTIYPELESARKRGVALDSCHGLNHFSSSIARYAISQGYLPTVISTDLASPSVPTAQSLPVVMSKFLNLGLTLPQVIEMTTVNPAKLLGEDHRRGSLKSDMKADLVVFELTKDEYLFVDGNSKESFTGDHLLEPRIVLKDGEIFPAYSAYHVPNQAILFEGH